MGVYDCLILSSLEPDSLSSSPDAHQTWRMYINLQHLTPKTQITDLPWFVLGLQVLLLIRSTTVWRAATNPAGGDFTAHSHSPTDHRHPWEASGRFRHGWGTKSSDSVFRISCFFNIISNMLPNYHGFLSYSLYSRITPRWPWCSSVSVPVFIAVEFSPSSLHTWLKNHTQCLKM